MDKNKKIILGIIGIFVIYAIVMFYINTDSNILNGSNDNELVILSSSENSYLEEDIRRYASKNNISIEFVYMGDLDIVEELNNNSDKYDGVWISNSMWLYMLDNSYLTSNSKSISISPVVVGIKKNKAEELDLIDKDITNIDILNLIRNKSIKYVMSSVTRTNTGATAYFGFLDSLAGNPEVLTEEMLDDDVLINNLVDVFSGVERVSGDEDYLEEMFLNSDDYEAVIADEASLININKNLVEQGKVPLYLLYPTDGMAINDSTLAFIDNGKDNEEAFLKIENYLLSGDGQSMLESMGRRTWYGGVKSDVDKKIFNLDWGIDTTKYLNVTKFPSKSVMTRALNLYIERFRKPTHVVFCLDYSGSMSGNGINELINAMNYILDYDEASKEKLQFSERDKITVITFSSSVTNIWTTDSGYETDNLRSQIATFRVGGKTALYDAIIKGLDILDSESDDYTKTVIAMTDGIVNVGSYTNLYTNYNKLEEKIPVYSIMFGESDEDQLSQIAVLTNAKIFDGKTNLLNAFKEVRGYN